ncbi:hypothetical protein F5884DRAFT_817596 [Xylogone sp. PMI_703]|nr:hypothetical protein F5884DRAFT_817596 [Xylogone sp. PMI_703]
MWAFDAHSELSAHYGCRPTPVEWLPDSFCCGPDQDCLVLAAGTTVLCCPSSASCDTIQPITCDISQQNATLHPNNALKTTALNGKLESCGGACCPFGYSCNSQNLCDMDADQSIPPALASTTSASPSATASSSPQSSLASSPVSSLAPTGTSNALTSIIPNTTSTIHESCDRFPVDAVLVGFFPGMFLGAVLGAAGMWLLSSQNRNLFRRRSTSSSFGNTISEPQPFTDMRSDFLRKPPPSPSTLVDDAPNRRSTIKRVRSLFRRSLSWDGSSPIMTDSADRARPPVPMIHKHLVDISHQNHIPAPVTPPLQRDPSYEDISIFADGDTANALKVPNDKLGRASHLTTFTDMMERTGLAGVGKGQRELKPPDWI